MPLLTRAGKLAVLASLAVLAGGCADGPGKGSTNRDTGSAPGRYQRDPTWPDLRQLNPKRTGNPF
ncbi:MAG: hypothetical protein HY059_20175 [Proteobacteria bacterium]|nr:hypothetical protein [Pseudomonadota bacterium]